MSTKQVNDELFDVILENAFSESFNRELERYEAFATKLSDATPTKEHRKCAQDAYKKKTRPKLIRIATLRRIAVAILIVLSIWNVLMLCSPTVQAAVKDTLGKFFDKYICFDFSKNDDFITIGSYKLGYITSGYRIIESSTIEEYEKYVFSNGTDDIRLRVMPSSISKAESDIEKRKMQPIHIRSYVAYALLNDDSTEPTVVIWGDENRSFILIGNLSLAELTKIANSLE